MYTLFENFLVHDLFRDKDLTELQECYKFYSGDTLCANEIIISYADEFYISESEVKNSILKTLSELIEKSI